MRNEVCSEKFESYFNEKETLIPFNVSRQFSLRLKVICVSWKNLCKTRDIFEIASDTGEIRQKNGERVERIVQQTDQELFYEVIVAIGSLSIVVRSKRELNPCRRTNTTFASASKKDNGGGGKRGTKRTTRGRVSS